MIALLLLLLASAAALIQVCQPLAWSPLDLPLLIACYAGLTRGGGWGLICGLCSGFWLDALCGGPAGLRLVPLALAGALADALQGGVNRDQPRLQVLAVAGLALAHDGFLALAARRLDVPQFGLERALMAFALPRLAGQALATLPLFWALGLLVKQKAFLDPRQREVQTLRRWQ